MNEFDLMQLILCMLALLLLTGGAGIVLLCWRQQVQAAEIHSVWQRQLAQAAETNRVLAELNSSSEVQAEERVLAFGQPMEPAPVSALQEMSIGPVPEPVVAKNAGEERLLEFIRQRTDEPLRELA